MWLAFVFLSGFLLLGAIIAAYLFLIQRNHWQPCPHDLSVPPLLDEQLHSYAQSQGGSLVGCEVYWIENEPETKRKKRRGNYRFGLRTNNHVYWSYWTRLPTGDFYPESPRAVIISRQPRLERES
jgi:hypothetical protein